MIEEHQILTVSVENPQGPSQEGRFAGVASMVSDGSFMADRSLFLKNGFRVADSEREADIIPVFLTDKQDRT